MMESFLKLSQSIMESPDFNKRECGSWQRIFAAPGSEAPLKKKNVLEAENQGVVKLVEKPKERVWTQKMNHFGKQWSGNKHLIWMAKTANTEMTLRFENPRDVESLTFGFTKANDYGTFDIYLDDQKILESINLYNPSVVRADDITVDIKVAKGSHTLKIVSTEKDERSRGHLFAIDYIRLPDEKKTETDVASKPQTDEDILKERVTRLLRHAFRRPAGPETADRYTAFAIKQLKDGVSFPEIMKTVTGAVIASPDFLYLYDVQKDKKGKGRERITDFELASRLSFFLWGSIPDERLLDLAEKGELSKPEVLNAELDRMLNDPKTARFCDAFATQWLQMDRLISSIPDRKKFHYFYFNQAYRASMHMMLEPLLLFDAVYLEDRSIMDLLTPDFSYRSDVLEGAYQGRRTGNGLYYLKFNRKPVKDPRYGGILTNAGVMTMTSAPDHTLPITRGAWINTVIFNDPPAPPPADVPPLPKPDEDALKKLTIRERFAAHRERKDCNECHRQIDPLGFAMENFGPTGVWRDKYENGREVDTSGTLFGKHEFTTLTDFKEILTLEKRRFIRGFTAHLMSYALGRGVNAVDSPAIEEITDKAMAGEDSLRTIIKRVALSEPFHHKNTRALIVAHKTNN